VSKIRMSRVPTIVRGAQRQVLLPALLLASSSALLLSGCGAALNLGKEAAPSGTVVEAAAHGTVHGGQAPVTGATVAYYAIGATSTTASNYFASLGTPLVSTTSRADGTWSVPSYACTPGDELYIVATGGNQIGNTAPNSALALVTVVGPCGNQFPHTNINIDEITTVATAYALNGFASDYLHIGTKPTNLIGLTNAVKTVTNLVDISQGTALTFTPFYNPTAGNVPAGGTAESFGSIVPYDAINTLADILASCVNTQNATDAACTSLFAITGGSLADPVGHDGVRGPATVANTADAAFYIAHNPGLPGTNGPGNGNNVANLYALFVPAGAPFIPTLKDTLAAGVNPNDWTLAVNFAGGGMGGTSTTQAPQSTNITIDAQGNVFSQSTRTHGIFGLSNLGVPLSPSSSTTTGVGGFISPSSGTPLRMAVDTSNNLWAVDHGNCLVELPSGGSSLTTFPSACPAGQAVNNNGIAVDTNGLIWLTYSQLISASNSSGVLQFSTGSTITSLTGFIGQDYSGNMWVLDQGDISLEAFNLTGGSSSVGSNGFLGQSPNAYAAFAALPSLYVPISGSTPVVSDVLLTSPPSTNAGLSYSLTNPTSTGLLAIASDGANQFFSDNTGGPTTAWIQVYNPNQVSPSPNAYRGASPQSTMDQPKGIAIDQSGNLWVVNQTNLNALQKTGPYGTSGPGCTVSSVCYITTGSSQSNFSEFIGLANPVNPVAVTNVVNHTYGTLP
jgi:hypothetical protein